MLETDHKTFEAGQFWLPLDNAAKIFPATVTSELTTVLRITAVLKERVRIKALMRAVTLIEKRFPYFQMKLKQGFFWYYLEHTGIHFPVEVDDKKLCRKFPGNGLLLRIPVAENRISVEFSHILTDGKGAFEFLKSIILIYFRECGIPIPAEYSFYRPDEDISEEEFEDAYKHYFKENYPPIVKRSEAFHLPFKLKAKPRFDVTHAGISIKSLKPKAREKGVSITDYLVSVYLYTLQQIYLDFYSSKRLKSRKPIRIQVPVNLRNILPSSTMRNFSLFVMPGIDLRLGHYTFDEIVKMVYHQMRLETDEKLIHKNISRNVGSERKLYVRSIPIWIKSLILRIKYYSLGISQYSGVLTNLGSAKFPAEMEAHIDHFNFIPPPPTTMLKVNCGIIGFGDKLVLSFGNITQSDMLEKRMLEFIESQNVEILYKDLPVS
ncbi:MAG: hypothetical protein K9I94_11035 [Bacteroidales bacterium]|nr:hypothetical protein [Bacteroidales bacterium]